VALDHGKCLEDKHQKSVLHEQSWARVIADEAAIMRDKQTLTFQAMAALQTQRRWALTGTPINNRIDDIVSLLDWLRVARELNCKWFNDATQAVIQTTLSRFMLRRTEALLKLPPLHREQQFVDMSKWEESVFMYGFSISLLFFFLKVHA
jgi:SNF2 family DNA or RNA helicase